MLFLCIKRIRPLGMFKVVKLFRGEAETCLLETGLDTLHFGCVPGLLLGILAAKVSDPGETTSFDGSELESHYTELVGLTY